VNPSVLKTRGQLSAVGAEAVGATAVGAAAVGAAAVGATAGDCAWVDTEFKNTRHEIANVILVFIRLLKMEI
jgi:hypothetical protein